MNPPYWRSPICPGGSWRLEYSSFPLTSLWAQEEACACACRVARLRGWRWGLRAGGLCPRMLSRLLLVFLLLLLLLPPQGSAASRVCPEDFSWCLSHPESECRGYPVRDFHQVQRGYAICRTTRPLSWVECRGSCPGQGCCQGLRLKRRKFTFECSDGTSFAEEVEKPSKCGCALCA